MKRGFLTTSKAKKHLEKDFFDSQYARTKTIMAGPLSHGVVQDTGVPGDYKSTEISYREMNNNTMDYAPDTWIYTTVPSVEIGASPADYPGGFTECFVSGHVKRLIHSTPGFPRLPQRPTGGKAYRINNAGQKGLGMFATRLIRVGDLIADERPMLVLPVVNPKGLVRVRSDKVEQYTPEQLKQISLREIGKTVKFAFDRLPPEYKKAFMELHNCHQDDGSNEYIGRTRTNGIGIGERLRDKDTEGIMGKYTAICNEISRINHSCCPNAIFKFHADTFSVRIHAVRDIPPGTEITMQYCELLDSAAERADALAPYGITSCNCSRSCSDPMLSKISDERRARFKQPIVLVSPAEKPKANKPRDAWVQPALTRLKELEEEGLQSANEYGRTLYQLLNVYMYLQDVEKALMYARKLSPILKAFESPNELDKNCSSEEGIKRTEFWKMGNTRDTEDLKQIVFA